MITSYYLLSYYVIGGTKIMLINSILLSLSSSIDSLGIGITYGMKDTTISHVGKVILFAISLFITILSLWFGNIIRDIFPEFFMKLIGSFILILMGFFICFQALKKGGNKENYKLEEESQKIYQFFIKFLGITIQIIKNPISSDFDRSKLIDSKEALFLGLALSLDSFCIGIGGTIIGISHNFFPFFIAIFQLLFLSLGNVIGKRLYHINHLPDNIWSIISGSLLILIGVVKLVF